MKLLLPLPEIESKFHILNVIGTFNELGNDRLEGVSEKNTDLLLEESMIGEVDINNKPDQMVKYDLEEDVYTEMPVNQV